MKLEINLLLGPTWQSNSMSMETINEFYARTYRYAYNEPIGFVCDAQNGIN